MQIVKELRLDLYDDMKSELKYVAEFVETTDIATNYLLRKP